MKLKRMPFSLKTDVSPAFVVLSTFLLSGAVIGAFTGIYAPNFEVSNVFIEMPTSKGFLTILIETIKYNIFLILLSRFFGFLIPFFVLLRGFFLSYTVSAVYVNIENFADKSVFIKSIANNIVSIPCFLIIATICLGIYVNKRTLNAKKARLKSKLDNNYALLIFVLLLNFVWVYICNFLF